ncbi:P-loop containing nucleoside triphosphate hydrolase protein [Serendipita vermifera]|nr:P-loop containing nucleoside triphosphate hydrolase protein [Serendipita vermifera]
MQASSFHSPLGSSHHQPLEFASSPDQNLRLMARNGGSSSEKQSPWTDVMLIGDLHVGKRSFLRRYVRDESPVASAHSWMLADHIKLKLPLESSPILPHGRPKHQQDKEIATTAINQRQHEPMMVEMDIHFYRVSILLSQHPIPLYIRRKFVYTSVIALCYDCSRPKSLHNAIYKWYPLVLHCASAVPIFLIGCKSDYKDAVNQPHGPCVTTEEAKKAARQIGAIEALECSAVAGDSVKRVGDMLAWYGYYSNNVKTESSTSLWHRLLSLLLSAERRLH